MAVVINMEGASGRVEGPCNTDIRTCQSLNSIVQYSDEVKHERKRGQTNDPHTKTCSLGRLFADLHGNIQFYSVLECAVRDSLENPPTITQPPAHPNANK